MKRTFHIPLIFIAFAMVGLACNQRHDVPPGYSSEKLYAFQVPDHFPDPRWPSDNAPTESRVNLGKKLFFDPVLSLDSSVACADCHRQQDGFSDPNALSTGIYSQIGRRNSMPIVNLMWGREFFWDGRAVNLEDQVHFPIQDPLEMGQQMDELVDRLIRNKNYNTLFAIAFGELPTEENIAKAVASYMRTLVSSNSPYDRYIAGDTHAISASAKRGEVLFFGEKAECFHCHAGFNFSDNSYQNNGLYAAYPDVGRMEVTGHPDDLGKFKVPTLRNLAYTAPYMHDGSMATLEEVITHYMLGGQGHPNQSLFIRPFPLTPQERVDLLNFLDALNDSTFITNPEFLP